MLLAAASTLQRGPFLFKQLKLKKESRRVAPKGSVSITVESSTHSLTAGAHAGQNFLLIMHAITYANMKGSKSIPLAAYRVGSSGWSYYCTYKIPCDLFNHGLSCLAWTTMAPQIYSRIIIDM